MLIANDNEASIGETLDEIREKRAGGLASGVRVNDINLGFGRFEIAKVGSERRLELFRDDFELGLV
jgi:hypothetical protein